MRIYPDETIQKSMTESITTVSNVSGYSPLYVAFMYITLWDLYVLYDQYFIVYRFDSERKIRHKL